MNEQCAILWIHDGKCRVIYKNGETVIDLNDYWNNRASAESECISLGFAPRFVRDTQEARIKELNAEWNACKNGA